MGRRRPTATSFGDVTQPDPPLLSQLRQGLNELEKCVKTARKNRSKLASHAFYGPKARKCLATLRRDLLVSKQNYVGPADAPVATELSAIEGMTANLDLDSDADLVLGLIRSIRFRVDSNLAAAMRSGRSEPRAIGAPFVPPEILPNGVYRRILEEANKCFDARCYNACAAMLRRVVESLIIEAFEAKGIEDKIKVDGEYCELKALIGQAVAELRLGRNTRQALPKLKFFGDLSVHSRRHLVREADLARLHADVRVALEELASLT